MPTGGQELLDGTFLGPGLAQKPAIRRRRYLVRSDDDRAGMALGHGGGFFLG